MLNYYIVNFINIVPAVGINLKKQFYDRSNRRLFNPIEECY